MPVRPVVCGSPAPMSAAEVEAQRVNAAQMTNTRVATFAAIRDTASWGIVDAMAVMGRLNAPMLRSRYTAEIADVQELQKQLETFKHAKQVSVQQTQQLPDTHRLANGRVERVPGGQRVLSETLFLDVNGTRLSAQDALQQVEQLAAEIALIATDNHVPLPPHPRR